MMQPLVLASTSRYRQRLLERAGLTFTAIAPTVDEEELKKAWSTLAPAHLCQKLGRAKAQSIKRSDAVVIGSDQLVHFAGEILGKPGSAQNAVEQLLKLSGQEHELITCTTIVYGEDLFEDCNITRLQLAPLSRNQIERYVDTDQPLDCAGAYRFEGRGITLMEKVTMSDATAIEGLPLIFVCQTLRQVGWELP